MEQVTFETKCWENDWRLLLETDYLKTMIARCNWNFTKKRLMINNVKNPARVRAAAQKAVDAGILDDYVFVDDYARQTLEHFHMTRDEFRGRGGDGYYYSIAELVSLYLADTEWLLHFSSDAMLSHKGGSFIGESIALMRKNPQYVVSNPAWELGFDMTTRAVDSVGSFYVEQGFSDQCYMVKTEVFKQDIYHFQDETSAQYPAYGGELFEKRVYCYLNQNQKYRLTHKTEDYIHRNITPRVELEWKLKKLLHTEK